MPDGDVVPMKARDLRPVWFNSTSILGNPNKSKDLIYPPKVRSSISIASSEVEFEATDDSVASDKNDVASDESDEGDKSAEDSVASEEDGGEDGDGNVAKQLSYKQLTFQDQEGTSMFPIPAVDVMLIRRQNKIARRVSVRWVYLTSWTKACPEFKIVYLE